MSTGNGTLNSSIANIAYPPGATSTASQAHESVASATGQAAAAQGYDYYSSPEYQQYYQQYYANAQQQQQYAAYYQQAGQSVDPSAYNPAALYGQTQAYGGVVAAAAAYQTLAATNSAQPDVAEEDDEDDEDDDPTVAKSSKASNTLTYSGNSKMNLNPLLFSNIQQSPYFKNNLFQLKTYHEVVDEIYYNVKHLEPWEKGSRKVSGQTGMCGSVRGVGAGGIISTPFCLLFKLYTLKLTRKQLNGLIRHKDSPFIRGLGFMFIRFALPPQDFWQWFEPYLSDDEEIDPKAGGGAQMTIGEMVRHMLTKLDWFSTLFPRIPIPVQKDIDEKLRQYDEENPDNPCLGKAWNTDRSGKSNDSYCNNKQQQYRSENNSKYSKQDSRNRRSRSRSPSSRHQDKRPRKYDDDRRNDYDYDRSNRNKGNRYY